MHAPTSSPSSPRRRADAVARAVGLAALALVMLAARAAPAQEQRDPREAEAKKACLAGKPERGIEVLAELYADTNDPTYIYNQGRCFEQNGKAAEALTRFREYLRKASNLAADDKAQVQAHIKDMEEQARPSAAPAAAPPAQASGPAAAGVTPTDASTRDGARSLRVAGVVTASVGAVVLAGGVYFGLRTKSLESEVTADSQKGMFSQSKYDEGRRDQTLQWIGYGVGAAAVASGAMLYVFGARHAGGRDGDGDAADAGTVTAMPMLGAGRGGAMVRVVF